MPRSRSRSHGLRTLVLAFLFAALAAGLLLAPAAPATSVDWRASLAAAAAGDAQAGLPAHRKETIARSLALSVE